MQMAGDLNGRCKFARAAGECDENLCILIAVVRTPRLNMYTRVNYMNMYRMNTLQKHSKSVNARFTRW